MDAGQAGTALWGCPPIPRKLCALRHFCACSGRARSAVGRFPPFVAELGRRRRAKAGKRGATCPPAAYRAKFSGKYEHRDLTGGIGHNLPQEAPQAFAQAVADARTILDRGRR
jgi:hypothetical protein